MLGEYFSERHFVKGTVEGLSNDHPEPVNSGGSAHPIPAPHFSKSPHCSGKRRGRHSTSSKGLEPVPSGLPVSSEPVLNGLLDAVEPVPSGLPHVLEPILFGLLDVKEPVLSGLPDAVELVPSCYPDFFKLVPSGLLDVFVSCSDTFTPLDAFCTYPWMFIVNRTRGC